MASYKQVMQYNRLGMANALAIVLLGSRFGALEQVYMVADLAQDVNPCQSLYTSRTAAAFWFKVPYSKHIISNGNPTSQQTQCISI